MLWDTGVLEAGWAFGELLDAHGEVSRSGWYPPSHTEGYNRQLVEPTEGPPELVAGTIHPARNDVEPAEGEHDELANPVADGVHQLQDAA